MSSYTGPNSETAQRIRDAIGVVQTSRVPNADPFPSPPADAAPLLRRPQNGPYVGDIPGGVRPPSVTLTDTLGRMVVWMVWVVDDQDPDQVPWLVDARDDASVQRDPEDWEHTVQELREEYDNIIVTRTSVDYGKVRTAFEPLDI